MTDKTYNKIANAVNIAFHRLALGLYEGNVSSRGKCLMTETMEYVRLLAKNDNVWRNILKTKEQKRIAVGYLIMKIKHEFGESVVKDYMMKSEEHC